MGWNNQWKWKVLLKSKNSIKKNFYVALCPSLFQFLSRVCIVNFWVKNWKFFAYFKVQKYEAASSSSVVKTQLKMCVITFKAKQKTTKLFTRADFETFEESKRVQWIKIKTKYTSTSNNVVSMCVIKCHACHKVYIGERGRCLGDRFREKFLFYQSPKHRPLHRPTFYIIESQHWWYVGIHHPHWLQGCSREVLFWGPIDIPSSYITPSEPQHWVCIRILTLSKALHANNFTHFLLWHVQIILLCFVLFWSCILTTEEEAAASKCQFFDF